MRIVLGAGLSGLSLAVALVRAGVREEIVVVDRRTTFDHDRTWCTWALPQTPFLECATHTWTAWEVRDAGRVARGSSSRHPYVHVPADAFYAAALAVLDAAPQVTLRLGERVLRRGDGWAQTDRERLEGHVYDGRGRIRSAPLWQGFEGWEVRTEQPRFQPGVVTLMDFGVDQLGAIAFLYTLPFSPTHALVEHTTFAARGPAPSVRRAALRAALAGTDYTVLRTERGRLPMTTQPLPARRAERLTMIGVAGGALRASSGYAFSRVQAHSLAIAAAVAAGRPEPARAGARHRAALDAVLLGALGADPSLAPQLFADLVARTPGDAFARFMADGSSRADELAVVAAAPPLPLAGAALRLGLRRG